MFLKAISFLVEYTCSQKNLVENCSFSEHVYSTLFAHDILYGTNQNQKYQHATENEFLINKDIIKSHLKKQTHNLWHHVTKLIIFFLQIKMIVH